jgi:3-keto-5-aminohexanoate cleavage enzyme
VQPLVIEVALNGMTPKAHNPHVPRTPREIAADACACLEAGASIVHHHNDEGLGEAQHASFPYAQAWREILHHEPDAILYPTMGGGGVHTDARERYTHVVELAEAGLLRMALIDPGSLSLGVLDREGLPAPIDLVYQNTFADVRTMADLCLEHGLAAHVSIFEPGFLRVALACIEGGRFPPPKISLYFGGAMLPFGLPPTSASLDAYQAMLKGTGLPWMVAVLGGDVRTSLAEEVIQRGGHVRVGLEDFAGEATPSNAELVVEIAELARALGRPIATCKQAAEIFGVPESH